MTQEDDYKSPWKDKYTTTVNNTLDDTAFTFLNSFHDDTSDLTKQVVTSNEPMKDTQTSKERITDTQIVDRVRYLQYGPTNVYPVVTGVGIIGHGWPRDISGGIITQSIIHGGGSIIGSNVITHVLTCSSEMTLKSNLFPFNPLKAQTLVIAPLTEPFLTSDREVHTASLIGYSRPNLSRIGTPFTNTYIWSRDDALSVQSDVGELDKIDTAVQRSSTDKRTTASSLHGFTADRKSVV